MEKPWYRRMFSSAPAQPNSSGAHARATEGDAAAQFYLGLHYSSSEGAAQDLPEALRWYRLAADQNHHLAQFNLGVMLEKGQGTEKDGTAGRMWIRRAAEAGDAGAQFNCGNSCYREMMTTRENNVPALRIEAYMWFELAAVQGYRSSESSRDRVSVMMTHAEVAEANTRVARFVVPAAA